MDFSFLSSYGRRKTPPIPTSVDMLGRSEMLVLHLLKEIYQLERDDIKNFEVFFPTGGDIKGNLSDSGRVQISVVTEDEKKEEFNWFVKVMPHTHPNNELVSKFNVFENEIEFYSKIAPMLKQFIKEKVSDSEMEFDIPSMLYAKQEDNRAIIILEDLTAEGYVQERDANGNKFLTPEMAILAVKSIAKIHAASYALQLREKVDLKKDHPILEESGLLWTHKEMTSRLFAMKDMYCEILEKSDKPDSPILLEKFRRAFNSEELLIELCKNRMYEEEESVNCLQQGDFHFNNLLFRRSEGRLEVKIVDWQLTYSGRAGGDISYLLMSSLDQATRESEEEKIKQEYYRAFISNVQLLRNSTDSDIAEEEALLREDYLKSLPLGFFFSCGNIMAEERPSRRESFTYELCKEAAKKHLI